jgi:hypothetical protein
VSVSANAFVSGSDLMFPSAEFTSLLTFSEVSAEPHTRRSTRVNSYKSRNNLPMKTKPVDYILLVDVKIIELQKMLKLISLLLEKTVDTTLHFS